MNYLDFINKKFFAIIEGFGFTFVGTGLSMISGGTVSAVGLKFLYLGMGVIFASFVLSSINFYLDKKEKEMKNNKKVAKKAKKETKAKKRAKAKKRRGK